PRVGNHNLDAGAVVALKDFQQMQNRLGLGFEAALSFYRPINTETHTKPGEPNKEVPSFYTTLFQNPAVVNPVNPAFDLPLRGTEDLADHRPTLLAGLAVREADLALLIARTDGALTLANLTRLLNHADLARGLKLTVGDLLALVDLGSD